jgi:hypothetical protein
MAAIITHVTQDIVITQEVMPTAAGPITIQDTTRDVAGVAAPIATTTSIVVMVVTTVATAISAMKSGIAMTGETVTVVALPNW